MMESGWMYAPTSGMPSQSAGLGHDLPVVDMHDGERVRVRMRFEHNGYDFYGMSGNAHG